MNWNMSKLEKGFKLYLAKKEKQKRIARAVRDSLFDINALDFTSSELLKISEVRNHCQKIMYTAYND